VFRSGNLLLWCLAVLLLCGRAAAEDPPRLEPTLDAAPNKAWAWTSAGGLRYTWVLPAGIAQGEKRDLVVICHGTGLDYRWGAANCKPGEFRASDFVVSVDGPSKGPEDSRLFMGREEDAAAFASFLGEMQKAFPVRRVFLYGHSQGGFFVVYFAGENGDMVDGVVAHASGAWNWSKVDEATMDVPIVFMHGTGDPVVPYEQSLGSRDHYTSVGHGMTALRRMPRYNHWPNAVRASECIDWCIGIQTTDPPEAFGAAEALLRVKPADEYSYRCPVWFSGAAAILGRFRGRGENPFQEGQTGGVEAEAIALLNRVEAEGAGHVELLKTQITSRDDLKLDGRPWLGHLISLREDFRGVEPVEAFYRELGYDELAAKHTETSGRITREWYRQASDRGIFETAVRVLPDCFLAEGLPPELVEFIPKAFAQAQALNVSPDSIKRYRNFVMWKAGWDEGLKEYESLWSKWE
jgi:predicted esterase